MKIENTDIKTAPGVELSSEQKTIVGSVLDLFAGRPSLEKLRLWSDEAVFEDPITQARGRKEYEPQWVRLFLLSGTPGPRLTNTAPHSSTASKPHSARSSASHTR